MAALIGEVPGPGPAAFLTLARGEWPGCSYASRPSSGLCLQELGVPTGPPPPARLAITALRGPNGQPSSHVPRAPGVTGPDWPRPRSVPSVPGAGSASAGLRCPQGLATPGITAHEVHGARRGCQLPPRLGLAGPLGPDAGGALGEWHPPPPLPPSRGCPHGRHG